MAIGEANGNFSTNSTNSSMSTQTDCVGSLWLKSLRKRGKMTGRATGIDRKC